MSCGGGSLDRLEIHSQSLFSQLFEPEKRVSNPDRER